VIAPLPPQILPRATPSPLVHSLSDKFCDRLPFTRREC
jgi:hypothetical protein